MKYLALLRGINVGGNSIIKMADLKSAFEKCGFTNVSTFIQSGNVIFETSETDQGKIAGRIEKCLEKEFHITSSTVVLTVEQFNNIVREAPADWNSGKDLRKYVSFVKIPATAQKVLKELQPRDGIDSAYTGDGVVYMSTLLSGITKSGFTKVIRKPVYQSITMRNYNTVLKLAELMGK